MMPAGKYYIGDLCYVMHDKWDAFCDHTCSGDSVDNGEMDIAGVRVASYGTAYGDGEYLDGEGRRYPVDAGLIGCIKVDDIDPSELKNLGLGNVVDFTYDFHTGSDGKVLSFGHVYIDTDPRDEEDDYEDYEDADEEEDEEV